MNKKVFISHNSLDKEYCDALFELIALVIGGDKERIFYSSRAKNGVKNGQHIIQAMKEQYDENELFMIIVSSPRYYKSPKSLNEMGAAWVLNSKITVFLTPDAKVGEMKGVINSDYLALSIDDKEIMSRLDMFKNDLVEFFGIISLDEDVWDKAELSFLERVRSIKYEIGEDTSENTEGTISNIRNKTIDKKTIIRLFSHYSFQLIDDYSRTSNIEFMDQRLPTSYEWWEYVINSPTFILHDKKLDSMIRDLYNSWESIMCDNWKYYSPSESKPGFYEFYYYRQIPQKTLDERSNKVVMTQKLLPTINQLSREIARYIQEQYQIDLTSLSERFEKDPWSMK